MREPPNMLPPGTTCQRPENYYKYNSGTSTKVFRAASRIRLSSLKFNFDKAHQSAGGNGSTWPAGSGRGARSLSLPRVATAYRHNTVTPDLTCGKVKADDRPPERGHGNEGQRTPKSDSIFDLTLFK